jgi:hypothetical protein
MTFQPTEAYIATCNGTGCGAQYKDPDSECVVFFTAYGRAKSVAEGSQSEPSGNSPQTDEGNEQGEWLFCGELHWCPDCRSAVEQPRLDREAEAKKTAEAQASMTPLPGLGPDLDALAAVVVLEATLVAHTVTLERGQHVDVKHPAACDKLPYGERCLFDVARYIGMESPPSDFGVFTATPYVLHDHGDDECLLRDCPVLISWKRADAEVSA